LIFQQPSLYPWPSALDNVAFGLMLQGIGHKGRRRRAEQFFARLGCATSPTSSRMNSQGGMQQRAANACALFVGRLGSEVIKVFQE
jgi:ABC-type taurine transport system ATPase subunit